MWRFDIKGNSISSEVIEILGQIILTTLYNTMVSSDNGFFQPGVLMRLPQKLSYPIFNYSFIKKIFFKLNTLSDVYVHITCRR